MSTPLGSGIKVRSHQDATRIVFGSLSAFLSFLLHNQAKRRIRPRNQLREGISRHRPYGILSCCCCEEGPVRTSSTLQLICIVTVGDVHDWNSRSCSSSVISCRWGTYSFFSCHRRRRHRGTGQGEIRCRE